MLEYVIRVPEILPEGDPYGIDLVYREPLPAPLQLLVFSRVHPYGLLNLAIHIDNDVATLLLHPDTNITEFLRALRMWFFHMTNNINFFEYRVHFCTCDREN